MMDQLIVKLENLYSQIRSIEKEIESLERQMIESGKVEKDGYTFTYSKEEKSWRAIRHLGKGKYENIYLGTLEDSIGKIQRWKEKHASK